MPVEKSSVVVNTACIHKCVHILINHPVPYKASEQKNSAPNESSSVRCFPLRTRQRQPIIHMTFTVQNSLKKVFIFSWLFQ